MTKKTSLVVVLPAVVLLLGLGLGTVGRAQTADFGIPDLDLADGWGARPFKGNVVEYVEGAARPDPKGGPPKAGFHYPFKLVDAGDGTRRAVQQGPTGLSMSFDEQGRRVRTVSVATRYPSRQLVTKTTTATRDADGRVRRLDTEADHDDFGSRGAVVHEEATADGGRLVRWETTTAGDRKSRAVFWYDAGGRLTGMGHWEVDGAGDRLFYRVAHNERGDVASVTDVRTGGVREWKYEYDAAGNWTRRTQTVVEPPGPGRQPVPPYVAVRQIKYGPARKAGQLASSKAAGAKPPAGKAVKASAKTTKPAAPAPAPASGATPANLVGRYRHSMGKPGEAIVMVMEFDVQADQKLRSSIVTDLAAVGDNPARHIARGATGSWSVANGVLTVRLAATDDGKPVPPGEDRPMRLRVAADGQTLTAEHNPRMIFARVAEGGADSKPVDDESLPGFD